MQLASLNLIRDRDGTVDIVIRDARGALGELDQHAKKHVSGQPVDYVDRLIVEAADTIRLRAGIVIPMVLHCPSCGTQHIDEPAPGWINPPHRSHSCQQCGTIWRPCDLPTTGVAAVTTKGQRDNWQPLVPEEQCPGHAASDSDPKICKYCGVHIDALRPLPEEP